MVKNLPAIAGVTGSISGLGKSRGVENGNTLWYSCLGNPMGTGAWRATVQGVTKSPTRLGDKTTATTKLLEQSKNKNKLLEITVPQ